MLKGYWIVRFDTTDPEKFKLYVAANGAPIARFGGKFLVRRGRFEAPEGESRSVNVVIEFPSYQAALDCYRSAAYQEALQFKLAASTGETVIIEGYDGPQPS